MLERFLRELFLKGAGIFSLFNSLDVEPGFCFLLPKGCILYRGWGCLLPSQLSFRLPTKPAGKCRGRKDNSF